MGDSFSQALVDFFPHLLPEALLLVAACGIFLGGTGRWLEQGASTPRPEHVALTPRRSPYLWFLVSLAVLVVSLLVAIGLGPSGPGANPDRPTTLASPLVFDALAWLIRLVALGAGVVLVLFSWSEVPERQSADFLACLLLTIAGTSMAAAANDLIVLFLSLELISLPTYVLLYLPRHDEASQEAAMKYFLLSVFSSALMLFGFSYLYGLAGTTNLSGIVHVLNSTDIQALPATAAVAMIMVVGGLGFKITAVPFHFYAPDVYQGAPTCGAAFLAFVPKAAGFVALLRVLGYVVPTAAGSRMGMALGDQGPILLWFLAVVTMFLGNLLALWQDNLKRLLAYSSIAHAGYMLVALAVAPYLRQGPDADTSGVDGVEALLFYLVAYGAMTVGAFAVISYLSTPERPLETVDDLAGLSRSHPGIALLMVLFLFSLIGIPLTAGFTGKLLIFFGAMGVPPNPRYPSVALFRILAFLGMVNAAIGGWYYLRIVAVMYLRTSLRPVEGKSCYASRAALAICAILTIGLSVPPGADWLLQAARKASGAPALSPAPAAAKAQTPGLRAGFD